MLPKTISLYARRSLASRCVSDTNSLRLLSASSNGGSKRGRRHGTRQSNPKASASIDVSFYEDFLRVRQTKASDRQRRRDDHSGKRPSRVKSAPDVLEKPSQDSTPKPKKEKKRNQPSPAKVEDEAIEPLEIFSLFAPCLPGLEATLHSELVSLGFTPSQPLIGAGGIAFTVDSVESLMKCHLHLGTATHILLRCGEPFKARGMEELRRKVSKMSFWKQYLGERKKSSLSLPKFDIRVTASKSRLFHTKGIAERVESGIYSALGIKDAKRTDDILQDNTLPTIKLVVRLKDDYAQISVDTSENPLHQRGYRQPGCGGKSPLREDIAFAILYGSGWRRLGSPSGDKAASFTHLGDPCCGSGTLPIEAAAVAAGLPPGRLLPQPLAGSNLADEWLWRQLVLNAEAQAVDIGNGAVMGSDRDKGIIAACKTNAAAAGVEDIVRFENCAVKNNPWLSANANDRPSDLLICTNPPFGVRSSKKKDLFPLYRTLVDAADESRAALTVLAHDITLVRTATRNEASVLFSTKHGGLSIAAMQYKVDKGAK